MRTSSKSCEMKYEGIFNLLSIQEISKPASHFVWMWNVEESNVRIDWISTSSSFDRIFDRSQPPLSLCCVFLQSIENWNVSPKINSTWDEATKTCVSPYLSVLFRFCSRRYKWNWNWSWQLFLPFAGAAAADLQSIQFASKLKSLQHSHFMIKILIELLFFYCADKCEKLYWLKIRVSSASDAPHQLFFAHSVLIVNLFSLIKMSSLTPNKCNTAMSLAMVYGSVYWHTKYSKISCSSHSDTGQLSTIMLFVSAVLSLFNSLNNVVIYPESICCLIFFFIYFTFFQFCFPLLILIDSLHVSTTEKI